MATFEADQDRYHTEHCPFGFFFGVTSMFDTDSEPDSGSEFRHLFLVLTAAHRQCHENPSITF